MKRYIRSATMTNGALARDSKDPKVLAHLANDEDNWVRRHVAENPNTPADILVQLANDEDKYVRWGVAINTKTPAKALAQLADDEDEDVRWRVATNSNTPEDVLAQLVNVEKWYVRKDVAQNPNTSVDILAQLANDGNPDVRAGVAKNRNTPVDILAQLANDAAKWVRKDVAQNPNTPSDILVQFADDEDVRRAGGVNELKRKRTHTNWPSSDYWDNIDGYEEMNDAWETYLGDPEDKINAKLQVYPETSVRMGFGSVVILDESGDENESISIDYQDWCDAEIEMAAESKNAKEYATKYEAYLKSIIDWL